MSVDQRIDYRTQLKKQPHIFDVTYYGAVGDGSTDNTAAIESAITAMGSSPGIVYFPFGKFNTEGGHILRYGTQSIVGMGKGTYINKTSEDGNLFSVIAASGIIFYNEIRNLFMASSVTQTSGNFIYIDPTAYIGELHSLFIEGCYNGINCLGGSTWHGSNLNILDPVNWGFNFGNGIFNGLKVVRNTSNGTSTGIRIDAADGLQLTGVFLEGQLSYGIYCIPVSGSTRVVDVSISNLIIDLFMINAIRFTGTGFIGLVNISNFHIGNQTPDSSNDHAIRCDGVVGESTFSNGRIFNNRKRGFSFEGGNANSNNTLVAVKILANSLASSGTYSAIYASSVNGMNISACQTGYLTGIGGSATHKYGLELAGTCGRMNVVGNNFVDNVTGGITGDGSAILSNFSNNLTV